MDLLRQSCSSVSNDRRPNRVADEERCAVKNLVSGLLFATAAAVTATTVSAHFKLNSPASWIVEDMRGDPQKIAPCGGTKADAGTPTNAVTKVQGGQKLHI